MAYAIGTDKRDGTVVPTTSSKDKHAGETQSATKSSHKSSSTGKGIGSTAVTRAGSDTREGVPTETRFSYLPTHSAGTDQTDTSRSSDGNGNSFSSPARSSGGYDSAEPENKLSFGQLLDFVSTPPGGPVTGETQFLAPWVEGSLNSPVLQHRIAANGGVAPFEGVVDWAGIAEALRPLVTREPVDITVRGGRPAGRSVEGSKVDRGALNDFGEMGDWPIDQVLYRTADRLPSEPLPKNVGPAPYVADAGAVAEEMVAPSAPTGAVTVDDEGRQVSQYTDPLETPLMVDNIELPRRRPQPPMGGSDLVWEDAVVGDTSKTGFDGLRIGGEATPVEGLVTGNGAGIDAAVEPSKWDNVVDNTGKLLSHTGLGTIVSTLFPDLWNTGGDMMKGLGASGGKQPAYVTEHTTWDPLQGAWVGGGASSNGGNVVPVRIPGDLNGDGVVDSKDKDANGNGIPDIDEKPTDGTGGTDGGGGKTKKVRRVTFPGDDFDPGIDGEFQYFSGSPWASKIKRFAEGGPVPYAEGGNVGMLDQQDPRVTVIADAEDALENMATGQIEDDDEPAIRKFVELFGEEMLDQLRANVTAGMKMRTKNRGRTVEGPGGPTDDAVPAVIDGVQPAKLSSGEFVMPVDAVEGAGEGDPAAGAEKLQQLSEALAGRKA